MRSLSLHVILNRDQVEKLAKSYVCTGNPTNRPFQTPLHPGGASGTSSRQWKRVEVRNTFYRSRKLKACVVSLCTSPHSVVVVQSLSRGQLLRPHGLSPARLLCLWDFPGKNTGVGCHFLIQGIFLTQGSNPGLLHCRQILHRLSYEGSPSSFKPPDCVDQSDHHHYIRL